MTLNFRRFLFVLFVIIFALAGIVIVYYTKGYRIDFSNFSVVKTGGVYIEANVSGFQINLGDEIYQDQSNIFKKSTLISNVIPKKYALVIKKDGYYDYEKNIEVLPSQVVRLLNVLLVPKEIQPSFSQENILGNSIVAASGNGKILTLDSKKGTYYVYDFSSDPASFVNVSSKISALTSQKILSIWFNPQKDGTFIIKTSKGLYQVDINGKTFTSIQIGTIGQVKIDGNNLYAVVQNVPQKTSKIPSTSSVAPSKITTYDLVLNSQASEFQLPFSSSQITDIGIGNGIITVLLSDGALYAYDSSGSQLYQIAHSAQKMLFSQDKTKLFFQDMDGKTFIYTFDDEQTTLDVPKNTSVRLKLVDTGHISNIWWYPDSFHLILQYPDKITVSEVTQQNPNENFTITDTTGNAFYSAEEKTLYILDSGVITLLDISKI